MVSAVSFTPGRFIIVQPRTTREALLSHTKRPGPPLFFAYLKTVKPAWVLGTRQWSFSSLPPDIQTEVRLLVDATSNTERTMKEHGRMALQFADGRVVRSNNVAASSFSEDAVSLRTVRDHCADVFSRARERIASKPQTGDGVAKLFILHTHPLQPEHNARLRAPVEVDEQGNPFTVLTPGDYHVNDTSAPIFLASLRKLGFRGPVDIIMGAIPVFPESAAMEIDRLFVATYTIRLDVA